MLKRYLRQAMAELWDERTKYLFWLKVELAVLLVRMRRGQITAACYNFIRQHADFTVDDIHARDKMLHHDLQAFVESVQATVMEAGLTQKKPKTQMERWVGKIHKGITSYDTEDPALMLMLRHSCRLILDRLVALRAALLKQSKAHRGTLMIARTHGQPAEPDYFGRLLLTFVEDIDNCIARLKWVDRNELSYAKLSGAVGNYAGMDPTEEREVLKVLGLRPVKAATQIVQRDRHAMYICTLAVTAGCLERLARVLWELSRFEIREIQEPRIATQKGSSAMPHKKNPITLEQLQGVGTLLRGYAQMTLETISTPDCRDIKQSIVERHVFPDATYMIYYGLDRATEIITNLVVFPERMRHNLHHTAADVWAGQSLKVALLDKGIESDTAYRYVQSLGFQAMEEGRSIFELMDTPIGNGTISAQKLLGKSGIKRLSDPQLYLTRKGGVQEIYGRFAA